GWGVRVLVAPRPDGDRDCEVLAPPRWPPPRRNRLVGLPEPDDAQVAAYLAERAIVGTPHTLDTAVAELAAGGVDELICWCRWGTLGDRAARSALAHLTENRNSIK
ncbi:MAG: hypothetical protein OXC31_15300, partial [Spirochaetaceae bacterium]|nr:hypothetical protein [Spirochaetaceae bacterium]